MNTLNKLLPKYGLIFAFGVISVLSACQPTTTSIGRTGSGTEGSEKTPGDPFNPGPGNPGDPGSGEEETIVMSQEFLAARAALDGYCMGCHANGSVSWGIKTGASEGSWINSTPRGLIVPGNASESRLVKYMIYSPSGVMPPSANSTTFPKSNYDAIVTWINSIKTETTSTELGEGMITLPFEYQKMGDRRFVYRNFLEIFGPTMQNDARRYIHNQVIAFGGACDPAMGYAPTYTTQAFCLNTDAAINLTGGSVTSAGLLDQKHWDSVDSPSNDAPLNPDSSAVREGYRTFVCERALLGQAHSLTYNGPLYHALQKINDNLKIFEGSAPTALNFTSYPADGSVPTQAELRAAYRMFFSYREPAPEVLAKLDALARTAKDNIRTPANNFPLRFEPWRYVLLAMCLAPDNQIQ